jgi:hypothetical protein
MAADNYYGIADARWSGTPPIPQFAQVQVSDLAGMFNLWESDRLRHWSRFHVCA